MVQSMRDSGFTPVRSSRIRCVTNCVGMSWLCVFFFKQKTAYEMRISDWSSDVCSSDLPARCEAIGAVAVALDQLSPRPGLERAHVAAHHRVLDHEFLRCPTDTAEPAHRLERQQCRHRRKNFAFNHRPHPLRSHRRARLEEQPSELQSLMPHSYAVFCLKKKTD